MTQPPGPYDEFGQPQDRVPGRDPGYGAPQGYGAQQGYDAQYGDPYAQQSRGGFSMFPFPSYSTRTRNGTMVSVGGCCLPLPLGCMTVLASTAGYAAYRALRTHR